MEVATAGLLAGLASAGASVANNSWNILSTNKMNRRQEALMRESWSREDNAVQRRVADLKAAGLSPTLAAGSAAAASGPIKLNTPQSDLGGVVDRSLEAASAVKALRTQELQNENLKKQGEILDLNKEYYGYPDWAVAGIRMFGLEGFKDMIRKVGGNLFGNLFGDDTSSSGTPSSSGSPSSSGTPSPSEFTLYKPEYNEPVVDMGFSKKPVSEIMSSDAKKGTTAYLRDRLYQDKDFILSHVGAYFDKTGSFNKLGENLIEIMAKRYKMTYDDAARMIYDWCFDYLP